MTVIDWRELPDRDGFGFDVRVEKYYDQETRPSDYDCYTPAQVAAWERNDWEFVGLVVTARLDGIELGSAALWAIESGEFPHTTEDDVVTKIESVDPLYEDDYLNDLVGEAVSLARATLKKLCDRALK